MISCDMGMWLQAVVFVWTAVPSVIGHGADNIP